jgi:hypothetical protein
MARTCSTRAACPEAVALQGRTRRSAYAHRRDEGGRWLSPGTDPRGLSAVAFDERRSSDYGNLLSLAVEFVP